MAADDAFTSRPFNPAPATTGVDVEAAKVAVRDLLVALGEDPNREGLLDTPRRVADMWAEFLDYDPGRLGTMFESETVDQLVVVSGMRVWSMCEHHLLPFWCDVAVGYLSQPAADAGGTAAPRVIGLSKMGRIAHKHAHRLQLQERLVSGIASDLRAALGHAHVAVVARGEHLCMTARGVRTPHRMTSSDLHGAFREPALRAEFLALADLKG